MPITGEFSRQNIKDRSLVYGYSYDLMAKKLLNKAGEIKKRSKSCLKTQE
ncbi:unnamed protein product [Prunus brigantina]